jgi:Lrp/AsnC family transcriptional regulator, regulator for asnA, asnC and gidA
MYTPDSVDKQIARLLAQDASQNSEILAKKLNLSSATIRRRLKRLLKSDYLRIIGVVDISKFELPLAAIFTMSVSYGKIESAVESLAKLPEIQWVSVTAGPSDIVALGRFPSNESLSNFLTKDLSKIKGLKNTGTYVCLSPQKFFRYIPFT